MYLKLIANDSYPKFQVVNDNQPVVGIKIDPQMQAVRITYEETKRVFFIVEEKFRKSHLISLLNEYSQPLGTLTKEKSSNSGEIELEGMKLSYNIIDSGVREINLYEANKLVLNCKIENEALLSALENMNYLLFAFSWFIFLLKEEKPVLQFA